MFKNAPTNEIEGDTISFRMDAEFRQLLRSEATKNNQPKMNLYARSLVQKALTGGDWMEQKGELEALRKELRKLRGDIATLAFVLLVKTAKEEPAQAEAWVRNNLAP